VEAAGDTPLLTMGRVAPDEVPYWINAANAVLVPSQAEGFGLSVIEAIACGVPAFGTPVGIHPVALHGIAGAYCAPWDRAAWCAALEPVLATADPPRVDGRRRAGLFSADRMAARVVAAWRGLVEERAGTAPIRRAPR
jgi:glycosyltransferase involved in cell wall biosynthesis